MNLIDRSRRYFMREKLSTYHVSLVPILACIAALLFSANFYQFLQKNIKKWWGWDFDCPTEQVYQRHSVLELNTDDRHVIIFDFDEQEIDHEMDRVHRDLEQAERVLRLNLGRALQNMESLHVRMDRDRNVEIRVERLNEEIHTKARNLERLEQALHRMEFEIEQAESTDCRKHKHHRKRRRKSIRIRVHR